MANFGAMDEGGHCIRCRGLNLVRIMLFPIKRRVIGLEKCWNFCDLLDFREPYFLHEPRA